MTPCDVCTNKLESHYTAALVMYGAQKCRDTVAFYLKVAAALIQLKKTFDGEKLISHYFCPEEDN